MADNNNSQAFRVKKKWSERDTTRFVELYEAEEVLWNVRLREYKNKDATNAALQHMIKKINFDITLEDVNKKINNIRSTYSQEKAKIKNSLSTESGADDVYVPSIPWFEIADRFLANVVKCRKSFTNLHSDSDVASPDIPAHPSPDIPAHPSPDIPAHPSPDITAHPSPDITAHSSSDIPAHISSDSDIRSALSSQQPNSDTFTKPQHTHKRFKRTLLPQHIEKFIDTLQSIKDQVFNSRETEDEFSQFAKNVASQLRQLPLMDALDAQTDILDIIKQKRRHRMHIENNPSSSSSVAEYIIEIPEPEQTFEISEHINSQHLDSQLHDATTEDISIEEAIRSIGGIDNNEIAEE